LLLKEEKNKNIVFEIEFTYSFASAARRRRNNTEKNIDSAYLPPSLKFG
jgi:hypothetical protein